MAKLNRDKIPVGAERQKALSKAGEKKWDDIFGVNCPNCDNSGVLAMSGDQCEWCYETPNSKFNKKRAKAEAERSMDMDYDEEAV